MAIESRSFDLELVGQNEDFLRISEKVRGRRFSIMLTEQAAQWLVKAWGRFEKSKIPSWVNQLRLGSDHFLLESKKNGAGRFLQLSVFK